MKNLGRCMGVAALIASGFAGACNSGPIGVPMIDMSTPGPRDETITLTASGVVNGTFTAMARTVFNEPSAKGYTTFDILTGQSPGLGIRSFAMHAEFVGKPETRHYDEMGAQITASITLDDSRIYYSNVNSWNRIDVSTIAGNTDVADGSIVYELRGTAAGSASSTESADTFYFTGMF